MLPQPRWCCCARWRTGRATPTHTGTRPVTIFNNCNRIHGLFLITKAAANCTFIDCPSPAPTPLITFPPRYSFSSCVTEQDATTHNTTTLGCCQEEESRHIRVEQFLLESITHTNTGPLWASRWKWAVEGLSAPIITLLIGLTEAGLFGPPCLCHGRNMRLSVSSFTFRLLNRLN